MERVLNLILCVGFLLAATGCEDDAATTDLPDPPGATARAALQPEVDASMPGEVSRAGSSRQNALPPVEPRIPEPRDLVELLPDDARQLLRDHGVAADMFADLALVPGSFAAHGEAASARVRRRIEGDCFVRFRAPEGWSVWARPPDPRRGEAFRQRLHGVAPEVVTPEGLAAWLENDPRRLTTLRVGGSSGAELAALAGLRIVDDELVALEADATPRDDFPGVFRLSLRTLGRELPVELEVTPHDGRLEVTAVRRVAGRPVAEFLRAILKASRP